MFVILYSSCLSDKCMHTRSVHFSHILLFATLWTVTCQASVSMGILQAGILEWVVMPSSRWSSQARDWTHVFYVSCISGRFFTHWATWEALIRYTLHKYFNPVYNFCFHSLGGVFGGQIYLILKGWNLIFFLFWLGLYVCFWRNLSCQTYKEILLYF